MSALSVLCVDADPDTASTMASRLADDAIVTESATNGPDALAASSDADVVVLGDAVEGTTVTDLLDRLTPPVVCCPADGDESMASRMLDHGAVDYVPRRGEWGPALARRVRRVRWGKTDPDGRGAMGEYECKIRQLQATATTLARVTDEMAVYRHVIEAANNVLDFDLSFVGIEIDGWIVPIARSNDTAADGARTMSVEEGLVGKTFRTGEAYLVEDVAAADAVDPARTDYRSGISVPVGDVGVFQAVACERGAFDRSDLELAELLCAHAAAVLTRIASERESRRERDRFAALFENVPDPVVSYRYENGAPIVEAVNPAFESVFAADSPVGKSLDDLIVPEGRSERAVRINDRIAAGEQLDAEVERETATGRRTFLLRNVQLSAGETRAGYAIYTDISDQKQHQETLTALQRTTRELIRIESETGIGDRLVEAAQRALSFPYAAVLRHHAGDDRLVPIAVSDRWGTLDSDLTGYLTFEAGNSLAWSAFESGETSVYADITAEPDVGRERPKVRAMMVVPIDGWGVFLVGSTAVDAFDGTDLDFARVLAASAEAAFDRTARETTLREREGELAEQNQRLERFASVVSHDLRNPLTIARGRIDLAREGDRDQLDAADDALARIESIIEDVLQLAHDDAAVEPSLLDLAACARDAWATVETGEATLSVEDCGTVRADRSHLQQLFENLFRNSVEHGSTGSRPKADDSVEHGSTANRAAADDVGRDERSEGGVSVRVGRFDGGFFVADDGPGIPPDEREAVFEYGHSNGGSSGLGLAIVEQIAEAHGWEVSVTDSAAGGARFEIRSEPSD